MTSHRYCKLPNNMEVAYQSRVELEHFYEDIFEKQVYLHYGITINDGDYIFDVGANIGLFTIFAHQRSKNVTVFTFEPAPPLFEILETNVKRYGVNAKIFNCGISNYAKMATLTFYPQSSGMSSFYGNKDEEKEVLRTIMSNQARIGVPGMGQVMKYVEELLEERFKSEDFECQLRRLSDIINEYRVGKISLLKIDVQKSELDVLRGIDEIDWPKIEQIVMEVHDIEDRLSHIVSLLRGHGYHVLAEQDELYQGSVLYNLYATRQQPTGYSVGGYLTQQPWERISPQQIHRRAINQREAQMRQRQLLGKRGNEE